MVLERENDDWVSCRAALNLNCSPETLKMVLERRNDDEVSRNAAENPNCPPDAKIKWMMKVGKITRFNSNKHEE